MKELSVKQLIENIYRVAKEKGVRIGDLETAAKVSQGYFSRVRGKEDAASAPSIEVIVAVAETLGVTIDDLIYAGPANLTPNETRILRFVDKVLAQTKRYELDWVRESMEEMTESYTSDEEPNPGPQHPLVEEIATSASTSVTSPCFIYTRKYDSKFFREENCYVSLAADGFACKMAPFTTLYLEKVQVQRDSSLNRAIQFELYLCVNDTISPLCRSDNNDKGLVDRKLELLYNAAAEATSHIQLSDTAKTVIDQFLSGKEIDPFDGDLPF